MKHTFLVSDETLNSHGFRIITDGIDTTRFEKNPIMLYMHETPIIIGRWENLQKKNGQLFADAVFDEEDTFSKDVMGKVDRGFLKATSLGISHEPSALQKDDKGNFLKQCELIEISIVSIPSNGNALKLYTDKFETVQLKLNQLSEVNSIATLLKLDSGQDNHTTVMNAVKSLKLENDTLKLKLDTTQNYLNTEANELLDLAVSRNFIKPFLKDVLLKQFETDFLATKQEILKLFPIRSQSYFEMKEEMKNMKIPSTIFSNQNWTLDDYRKNAPDELEANPELFQKLIAAEYQK